MNIFKRLFKRRVTATFLLKCGTGFNIECDSIEIDTKDEVVTGYHIKGQKMLSGNALLFCDITQIAAITTRLK